VVANGRVESSRFSSLGDNRFSPCSPVEYTLTVKKLGNGYQVTGPIECVMAMTCSRCLEEFTIPMKVHLDIELAPVNSAPQGSEVELMREDMDRYYFEGDELELDPFVYDEVLLNVPISPLCKDECKGLCDVCGQNKNYEGCSCGRVSGTLLAEKLKAFMT